MASTRGPFQQKVPRGLLGAAMVIVMALRGAEFGGEEEYEAMFWGPPNSSQDLRILHLFIISRILLLWAVPDNLDL